MCKYNKNYNRHQDCSDYLKEVKKEILLSLERQKTQITVLESENKELKNDLVKIRQKHQKDEI